MKYPMKRRLSNQYGVSIVTAIFLLVVLAGLGVAIVSVSSGSQVSAALDVQGTRAFQAARAGVEWGLFRQLRPTLVPGTCFTTNTFALPAGSSLAGFTVTVSCTLTTGPGTLERRQIIATACNQPGPGCPNPTSNSDYVQRVVQVEF